MANPSCQLPAPTHVDKLPPVVLDADPRLLDHVQVGASDGQGRVSTVGKAGERGQRAGLSTEPGLQPSRVRLERMEQPR